MIEKKLKEAFDPYYNAPLEVWSHFYTLCEEVSYTKNEKIKESGFRAKYGYFLLEGVVGSFVWKKNNYACLDFFFEGDFFADDYSLTTGLPSDLELIALENVVALQISKKNINILKETPIGKTLFLVGEEQDNAKREKQRMDLMTQTAEERYLHVLHTRKDILKRIPQKHIASYLGITKQSLSRIRRKISCPD
ncbi:Crp/Fnr family transcriptional regulator [Aquimarina sp. TRL1]|uniref:Crp/Fnr family transcriptional regulator n=1 Tax=Aquimarina sp. (strain TRL1) TaxID=2736252 RepID=UPI00158A3D1A|nr:Crp/Fnr family transcriptional regulator [Aquimarina sp. TRL1]QKX06926.1 Crp/Fnr family transcriptional regulator [Aquimarina sp. TRL1]